MLVLLLINTRRNPTRVEKAIWQLSSREAGGEKHEATQSEGFNRTKKIHLRNNEQFFCFYCATDLMIIVLLAVSLVH